MAAAYANPYALSQNPNPGNGPISDPASWDFITLAGQRSPGVIPRGGVDFKRVFKWDKKKGKGTDGATSTYVGKPPAEGSIKFVFWADFHFAQWENFLALFDYDPLKKQAAALDVDHPELRRLKIKSLIVEEIGTPKDKGDGTWEVDIKAFEYNPPPPQGSSVSTPKNSRTDSDSEEAKKSGDPAFDAAFNARAATLKQLMSGAPAGSHR